jgi:hypothetical protein
MIPKIKEKEEAIKLRKKGFSYSEILEQIPISRSTLSLWLRSVGLAKAQFQRTTQKRIAGGLRGAATRKRNRIAITEEIKSKARKEVVEISQRDLWLIGVSLYWAEGSKEKSYKPGTGIIFNNSDTKMILLFLTWLKEILKVNDSFISLELYIHETADHKKALKYWAHTLHIPTKKFKVYFKKNKIKTIRRNTGNNYHGLIRIRVNRSSSLHRQIDGWVEGICEKSL